MELDDLKSAWTHMEQRLDRNEALLQEAARDRTLDRSRSAVRRFGWGLVPELLAWIALVALSAPFWIEYRDVPHLLAAGLVLHLYGIAGIWSAATRALLATRVLYTRPVVQMQLRVAQLRRFTTISTVALGLPWFCLWLVLALVLVRRFSTVDLYLASPGWFAVNLGLGLAGITTSLWLARRWSRSPPRSARLRRVVDHLSGCNLRRARDQLEEAASFERG